MQIGACVKSTKVNKRTHTAFHTTWIWPTVKKDMQKGQEGGCTASCQESTAALSQRESEACTKKENDVGVTSKTSKENFSVTSTRL